MPSERESASTGLARDLAREEPEEQAEEEEGTAAAATTSEVRRRRGPRKMGRRRDKDSKEGTRGDSKEGSSSRPSSPPPTAAAAAAASRMGSMRKLRLSKIDPYGHGQTNGQANGQTRHALPTHSMPTHSMPRSCLVTHMLEIDPLGWASTRAPPCPLSVSAAADDGSMADEVQGRGPGVGGWVRGLLLLPSWSMWHVAQVLYSYTHRSWSMWRRYCTHTPIGAGACGAGTVPIHP
jgi:hypothetical protein